MRELPSNQLNPKIKNVWRINDAIWIVLLFLACFIPTSLIAQFDDKASWAGMLLMIEIAAFIVLLIIFLVIIPPIRFARWRYQLSSDYLDIARGIIWRKRFIIPFIRVQNTDTVQGPILRFFKLSSVTVSTAAGSHEIPGLAVEEAEELRDRAAEFARLAREDI